jgi:hypothetical protein
MRVMIHTCKVPRPSCMRARTTAPLRAPDTRGTGCTPHSHVSLPAGQATGTGVKKVSSNGRQQSLSAVQAPPRALQHVPVAGSSLPGWQVPLQQSALSVWQAPPVSTQPVVLWCVGWVGRGASTASLGSATQGVRPWAASTLLHPAGDAANHRLPSTRHQQGSPAQPGAQPVSCVCAGVCTHPAAAHICRTSPRRRSRRSSSPWRCCRAAPGPCSTCCSRRTGWRGCRSLRPAAAARTHTGRQAVTAEGRCARLVSDGGRVTCASRSPPAVASRSSRPGQVTFSPASSRATHDSAHTCAPPPTHTHTLTVCAVLAGAAHLHAACCGGRERQTQGKRWRQ